MLLRNSWYIGAWADELGDKPVARRICGDPVVLFRDGSGKVAALADRCCHRAAPLHLGSIIEAGIQCGYHGLVFQCRRTMHNNPGAKTDSAGRASAQLSDGRERPAGVVVDG